MSACERVLGSTARTRAGGSIRGRSSKAVEAASDPRREAPPAPPRWRRISPVRAILLELAHERQQLPDGARIRRAGRQRPLETEPRAMEVARLEPGECGVAERGLGLARGARALLR